VLLAVSDCLKQSIAAIDTTTMQTTLILKQQFQFGNVNQLVLHHVASSEQP